LKSSAACRTKKFLQKRLLEPLGMKDTTFWPSEEQVKRLAKTYMPNKDKTGLQETQTQFLFYPLTDKRRQPMPGGGLFSTAQDISRFRDDVVEQRRAGRQAHPVGGLH
jgi:CubicO group peptidase (beta-lactamase class C family)